MLNSTYAPEGWIDIQASKVLPNVVGLTLAASANATTNLDYKLTDDTILRSIQPIIQNMNFGDSIDVYVIDKDGIYVPANTILAHPVSVYYVQTSSQDQPIYQSVAPFKLKGGLYLRFAYTNTNVLVAATVNINLQTLKVLQ